MFKACCKKFVVLQSKKTKLTAKIFNKIDFILSENSFAWCVTPVAQVALTQSVWLLLLFSPYMPDSWPIFVSFLTLFTGLLSYRYFYASSRSKKEASLFLNLWLTAMLTVTSVMLMSAVTSPHCDSRHYNALDNLHDE